MKVLLIIEQCNPEWASVPQIGYQMFDHLSRCADVKLVTHARNKKALEAAGHIDNITYLEEPSWLASYFAIIYKLIHSKAKGVIWPLFHVLSYPVYAYFNNAVNKKFAKQVQEGAYDIVHSFSPVIPRYPVKIVKACRNTPFILGPVNGGVPFPRAFRSTAFREHTYLNFFRLFASFLPGYKSTYRKANRVLVGSSFTLTLIHKLFGSDTVSMELFYENGVQDKFFHVKETHSSKRASSLNLLFVGRLVPYKRADMAIKALARLPEAIKQNTFLTIVGDGPERQGIEELIKKLNLSEQVTLTKWLPYKELIHYYHKADVFCFPSIREFGGAVVFEAMAASLPCIIVKNGGIGEYVTEDCGFSIEPTSEEYIVEQIAVHIETLFDDRELLYKMSEAAYKRALPMRWENKIQRLLEIYTEAMKEEQSS